MKPLEHLANVSRQRLARRILQVMAEMDAIIVAAEERLRAKQA
jgi:hypothetical protein